VPQIWLLVNTVHYKGFYLLTFLLTYLLTAIYNTHNYNDSRAKEITTHNCNIGQMSVTLNNASDYRINGLLDYRANG